MHVSFIPQWAVSAGQHPIAMAHSAGTDSELPQNPILMIGGVHGDEPEGVRLAEATLEWLKSNEGTDKGAKVPWILIPCINPDGLKKKQRVNFNGVDLNRNWPSKNWSNEFDSERYFPGSHPSSEPETKAMVELIGRVQPRLIIHCHSWKPCIVCTGDLGRPDALRLAESSGYEVVDDIGYQTRGSLSQFGWHDNQIPVLCIEEKEKTNLEEVWPRFQKGIIEIFNDDSMRGR